MNRGDPNRIVLNELDHNRIREEYGFMGTDQIFAAVQQGKDLRLIIDWEEGISWMNLSWFFTEQTDIL